MVFGFIFIGSAVAIVFCNKKSVKITLLTVMCTTEFFKVAFFMLDKGVKIGKLLQMVRGWFEWANL